MKVAYLAYPFGGSYERLGLAEDWVRFFFRFYPQFAISAPWITLVSVVADTPENRKVGLAWNEEAIVRADALLALGEPEAVAASKGMQFELDVARRLGKGIALFPYRRAADLTQDDITRMGADLKKLGLW
jgi:hypothetical protein